MPAAKSTARRTSAARSTKRASVSGSTATRREVERQIARVETLLDDVGDALQLLGKDMGRGGQDAYQELTRTVRALRRDAQRTNRRMLKDFDKLRAAVTPSGTARRSSTATTSRSGGPRTATGSRRSTRAAGSSRAGSTAKTKRTAG